MTVMFMTFALAIQAQNTTVKGTVKDATGEPVIGATVKVQGSTMGVITDIDGNYTIDCPSNATLEVSYIGSKTQTVKIGGKNTIDITLQDESQAIDEVVVTALGIKRQARSLGYSTTKVGGDDFTEALSRYVRRKYNIELGELTAEDAKIEIASVISRMIDSSYEIKGKNMVNGLPVRLDLGANETVEAMEEVSSQIIDGITQVLEKAEPELAADVAKEGILLSGGGSLIYGMDRLISDKTGIRTVISDEPENVVAAGAGMAGEYIMVQDEESKK